MSVQQGGNDGDLKANLIDVQTHRASVDQDDEEELPAWWETAKLMFLLGFWYALNLGYNIYNKKALNLFKVPNPDGTYPEGTPPMSWTLSTMQMCTGLFIFGPMWGFGLRKPPNISMNTLVAMFPLGVFHALTHLAAVIALGAGQVSSFQILKAAEPLFTCFFSGVVMKKVFHWYVYLTILPIMAGVGYSAMGKSNGVNMLSFTGAMMSNLGSALRSIYSKIFMEKRKKAMAADPDMPDDELTASNMYALITIYGVLVSFPFVIFFELTEIAEAWSTSVDHHEISSSTLALNAIGSGVFYYTYNEVAFITLANIHAVTHAIANTFKRIVLIIATAIFFSEGFSKEKVIGSTIAILGVFLYSLAKQKDAADTLKEKAAREEAEQH
jgi:solute carrier family 35 protein E1